MHEEESETIPIPDEEPEVGDGISPISGDGLSDNEIEDIVLRRCHYKNGFTSDELKALVANDPWYQRLKTELLGRLEESAPASRELDICRYRAIQAFRRYQKMRNFRGMKRERIRRLKMMMVRRLTTKADLTATHSLQKIQMVLGVPYLREHQHRGTEFRAKAFGRLSSRAMAIRNSLLKPLVAPTETSKPESSATQS